MLPLRRLGAGWLGASVTLTLSMAARTVATVRETADAHAKGVRRQNRYIRYPQDPGATPTELDIHDVTVLEARKLHFDGVVRNGNVVLSGRLVVSSAMVAGEVIAGR